MSKIRQVIHRVEQAEENHARESASRLREHSPFRTGALRDSIHATNVGDQWYIEMLKYGAILDSRGTHAGWIRRVL